MPTAYGSGLKYAWQHQAVALLAQANPTQNQWYTCLPTTEDVRIYGIMLEQATTGETIEIEVVYDGITYLLSFAAVAGTVYYCTLSTNSTNTNDLAFGNTSSDYLRRAFIFEAQSVGVRIRKTTNNGAGTLYCKAIYGRLLPT